MLKLVVFVAILLQSDFYYMVALS